MQGVLRMTARRGEQRDCGLRRRSGRPRDKGRMKKWRGDRVTGETKGRRDEGKMTERREKDNVGTEWGEKDGGVHCR
jgi:hypothetical protein